VLNLGLPDRFLEHGSRDELLAEAGLDAAGIIEAVRARTGGAKQPAARTGNL
jgi:1-deoxy-D-xylulose-5-phosphate synthase